MTAPLSHWSAGETASATHDPYPGMANVRKGSGFGCWETAGFDQGPHRVR
jgi:hypothetical protein